MNGTVISRGKREKALIFALLFLLLVPGSLKAGEPPKEPRLRLETGIHTARINRIAVDAANRFLVTASDDKTVRLWELPDLRLVRILRPPIGSGHEGKIFAVAISPDGNTIAAAGWTGWEWEGKVSIYLFDRASGRMSRPKDLRGLPGAVFHLAYSRDGRYLVACLGGPHGIRIYQTKDYTLFKEDTEYGGDSYDADFSIDGRLVTASFDGFLRLYDKDFKRIGSPVKAPDGEQPSFARFSPDGTKIAVGYNDSTRVDVFSGTDLSYLFSPDTSGIGINDGNLMAVAWSTDGSLYAGGKYWRDGCPILRWADGGKGSRQDLPAAGNTIMEILPLREGRMVFGAGDPALGILDSAGNRTHYRGSEIGDFRDTLGRFLASYDGTTVQFGFDPFGKSPARFSIAKRLLTPDPAEPDNLAPPLTRAEGLEFTESDWEGTLTPRLKGKPLQLAKDEESRSLAVCPDGQCFLLGAEWYLRLFDRNGVEKWGMPIPIPGVAWSVNISGNGRLAVAALGDGTIRWYRLRDGQEILAFFPHRDRKRWVLWTPSGYYDASSGGEDLIGWHINNGKDQAADFFPVSRFRQQFYRPDVISKVLETLDEKEALLLADKEAGRKTEKVSIETRTPPVVSIAGNDTIDVKTSPVTVPFVVRSPSGEPVTALSALVSGLPAAGLKGIRHEPREGETLEMSIPVPEQNSEVAIIVENRFAKSEPATLRLRWKGEAIRRPVKPKLYILAVGVSTYKDESLKLNYAHADAEAFVKLMDGQKGLLYEDVKSMLLTEKTGKEADRDNILDGLKWLEDSTTPNDTAVIFLSGHGMTERGIYYFLPVNADKHNLKKTGLPYSSITDSVKVLTGKIVVFADTCKSGGIMGGTKGPSFKIDDVVNELIDTPKAVVVYASTTGYQDSREDKVWGHGAFTKAVLEGLDGKAPSGDTGKITIFGLAKYISDRVKELTHGQQTPTMANPSNMSANIIDFPMAVKVKK
ncbi:WD domain-containing protein, G-beta repeat-containing protein [Syntrophus gentianae]|uniref:WD domain-containing protein, G-beta repeat-containing protein n=1 Tax=Syntrophus gentianae TaxID=43775 RepID=A0A1H7WBD5_9BACT|nr:caspase family protein [Syntrophus gentianae]SEM18405.1 WD domain-containing protein, G-beta repeat-containing protein [Syntrophus gentianae]